MKIYISKKAISKHPLPIENLIPSNISYKYLKSSLLSNVPYLVKLSTDSSTLPLSIENSESKSVAAIKEAFEIIKQITNNTANPFITNSSFIGVNYDTNFKTIVESFQQFAEITVNGIIDVETLFKIDFLLTTDCVYDTLSKKLIGVERKQPILIKSENLTYKISIGENGNVVNVSIANGELAVNIVESIQPDYSKKIPVKNTPRLKAKLLESNPSFNMPDFGSLHIEAENIELLNGNQGFVSITSQNIDDTKDKIVPVNIDNSNFEIYPVKDTDNFVDIVTSRYYGSEEIIDNSFIDNDVPIFTLPARTPLPDKKEDARFQFYLNLLYYSNSNVEGTEIKEYGMKSANNYQRYDVQDLDNYNLYDNKFDTANPNTDAVLPNYYRFLKTQKLNNPSTEVKFNASGTNTISFIPDAGKLIRIPSRKFADSLYYHINFRHFEMLNTPSGSNSPEYVAASVMAATVMQMANTTVFQALQNWLQSEITTLYNETLDFFTKAYNFVITKLSQSWYRGTGGLLGAGVGATWGLGLDFSAKKYLWRKMTPQNEFTILYREEVSIDWNIEVGVGGSVGANFGSGKSKKGIGIKFLASVGFKQPLNIVTEYEFPIRPNETALLSAVIASFGGTAVNSVVDFLDYFDYINLSPKHYLTRLDATIGVEINGLAAAQAGYFSSAKAQSTDNEQDVEAQKAGLNINGILKFLNLPGAEGTAGINLGTTTSYTAEYDENSLIPNIDARVPKKVNFETSYFGKAKLNVGTMGGFLVNYLQIDEIIDFLSFDFDHGIMLVFSYELERNTAAIDLNTAQINLKNVSTVSNPVINGGNGAIKYQGKLWSSRIKMGFYSGDIDDFCVEGSETLLLLDTYKLKQVLGNIITLNFKEINNLVEIFYGLSFRFKLSGSDQNSHKLSDSLLKSHKKGTVSYERTTKDQVYENARKSAFGLSAGVGTKVEMKIIFADFIPVFQYLFKRHHIIYGTNLTVMERRKIKADIKNIRIKIINQLNPDNLPTSDIFKLKKDYHTNLYARLNQELDTKYVSILPSALNSFSYLKQLTNYLTVAKEFSDYLNLKNDVRQDELDIHNTMEALAYMSVLLNFTLALEAKIGLEASFNLKAQLGATVRLALTGEIALIDYSLLITAGVPVAITDTNDPLYAVLQDIKASLKTDLSVFREKYTLVRESLYKLRKY